MQRPRIPVWCGGWWPNPRPFRRAARWDGVAPELVGGATPTPENVGEIATRVAEHGADLETFDIAINGYSGGGEQMVGSIDEYASAGATWWLERIDTTRLFSLDQARQRIHAGPPDGGQSDTTITKGTP